MTDIVHRVDSCVACRNQADKVSFDIPKDVELFAENAFDKPGYFAVFYYTEDGNECVVTYTSKQAAEEIVALHNKKT